MSNWLKSIRLKLISMIEFSDWMFDGHWPLNSLNVKFRSSDLPSPFWKLIEFDLINEWVAHIKYIHSKLNHQLKAFENGTYKISNSANPRNACSSRHVISLLSICKLRNDVAPLNVFRLIICNELCDKSLLKYRTKSQFH